MVSLQTLLLEVKKVLISNCSNEMELSEQQESRANKALISAKGLLQFLENPDESLA